MSRLARFLVAVAVALVGGAALAAPAHAAPTAGVTVIRAGMTVDCTASTSARRYCTDAGIDPDNIVTGNCGDSYIYIYDDGGGVAAISYGFHSSKGWVVYRALQINWTNWSTGGGNFF